MTNWTSISMVKMCNHFQNYNHKIKMQIPLMGKSTKSNDNKTQGQREVFIFKLADNLSNKLQKNCKVLLHLNLDQLLISAHF